jgi:hypothetical protein
MNEFIQERNKSNSGLKILEILRQLGNKPNEKKKNYQDKIRKLISCSKNKNAFPNEKIIEEYLIYSTALHNIFKNSKNNNIIWQKPQLKLFQVNCHLY